MIKKIINFIRENPLEFSLLLLFLLVGAFLRLYRIHEYMTFLGDEGRDAIIVRRLLVYGDPILVGPGTSIGDMYLGPLYYYMMAPALFLARYSPVGPAVQIALLGVATIFLVWYVAREWWGKYAGLIAAGLYTISPTIIIFSRSSWNPNIMPFFALLSIYAIWRVWVKHEWKWLIVLGISFAFVLQSHYLGLLLAPTLFIFWLLSRPPIRYTLYASAIFVLLMSPLVIFDARHGWRNFGAMKKFVTERETVSSQPWNAIPKAWPVFEKSVTRLVAARNGSVGTVVSLVILLGTVISITILIRINIVDKRLRPYYLILSWVGFGLLGLSLYKKEIYDHYLGFIFPAPFLLLGALGSNLISNRNLLTKVGFSAFFIFLVAIYLVNSPVRSNPTYQMQRAQEVSREIMEKAGGKRFNIATISDHSNRDTYQYFLELWGAPVVDTDPQRVEYTVTDQLFVVCERLREECDPVHDPSAWITNFGWTRIESEWKVWGAILFKLVHAK